MKEERGRERERRKRDGCCFEAFWFLSSLPPLTLILPGSEGHTKQQKVSLSFIFFVSFYRTDWHQIQTYKNYFLVCSYCVKCSLG